jgi:hypothetical protein
MSTTRHVALSLAVLTALALAAGRAAATTPTTAAAEEVTFLSIDRILGDGRPPTTGPTNPSQRG